VHVDFDVIEVRPVETTRAVRSRSCPSLIGTWKFTRSVLAVTTRRGAYRGAADAACRTYWPGWPFD